MPPPNINFTATGAGCVAHREKSQTIAVIEKNPSSTHDKSIFGNVHSKNTLVHVSEVADASLPPLFHLRIPSS